MPSGHDHVEHWTCTILGALLGGTTGHPILTSKTVFVCRKRRTTTRDKGERLSFNVTDLL